MAPSYRFAGSAFIVGEASIQPGIHAASPRRERLVLKNQDVALDGRQAQERAADGKEHTPPPREAASGGDGGVPEVKGEREVIEVDDTPVADGEEEDDDDDAVR